MTLSKIRHRQSRKKRIRSRVQGTAARPRMTVFRSLTRITVQLIDDLAGKTLVSASTAEAKSKLSKDGASKVGALVAKKAKDAEITTVVFDRNGYKYHGRVQSLADAAREGGLKF